MQFFPSDEIITSLIKTGAKTLELPSGSKLRVGGLSYELSTILHLDLGVSGAGGIDASLLQGNSSYYIYVVVVDGQDLKLIASLNAEKPEGFPSYRRIGKITVDENQTITVHGTDFVTQIQQSQIETINLEVSHLSNSHKNLKELVTANVSKLQELESYKESSNENILYLTNLSSELNESVTSLLSKIEALQSESNSNTESIVFANNKIKDIDTILINLAVEVASRQSEYLSIKDITNLHASKLNTIEVKFNSGLGHRHDGKDSPLIDVVDLSAEGGQPGDVLAVSNSGTLEWVPSPSSSKKELCISWVENAPLTPVKVLKTVGNAAAFNCYELGSGGNGKKLFTSFKVPVEFKQGNKIKLSFLGYHEGTDVLKTYQFSCSSYLIKKEAAPGLLSVFNMQLGSVFNATANMQLKEHSFWLTTNGKIDTHEVSAGDLIYVSIEKINTGSTEDFSPTVVLDNGLSVVVES